MFGPVVHNVQCSSSEGRHSRIGRARLNVPVYDVALGSQGVEPGSCRAVPLRGVGAAVGSGLSAQRSLELPCPLPVRRGPLAQQAGRPVLISRPLPPASFHPFYSSPPPRRPSTALLLGGLGCCCRILRFWCQALYALKMVRGASLHLLSLRY